MSLAHRILRFYGNLSFEGKLPAGINIMNPFSDKDVKDLTQRFYLKYYNDDRTRSIILGINPGRFGAGATGIPFTDTLRLNENCGIGFDKFRTYEPSSVFIYDMISRYGGVHEFFGSFLFSAVCPLGFTKINEKGRAVNYNYYDDTELLETIYPFIVFTLKQQLEFGVNREVCFCLGAGKNNAFLRKLNSEHNLFRKIITLEHPRFIMQYRARSKDQFINKYIDAFTGLNNDNT